MVSPIMQEDHTVCEIEIFLPSEFGDIHEWNDYVEDKKVNIEDNQLVEPMIGDELPIANLSFIPWIDFDSMTNIIASPNQISQCKGNTF